MRPIDADAPREDLQDSYNELRKIYDKPTYEEDRNICGGELSTLLEVLMRIKEAPTLDVAPVVHGRWVGGKYYNDVYGYEKTCTACQREYVVGFDYNFCPYCGANMRCGSCEHYGWDMPQCKECGKKNDFKWYKAKMDTEGTET